MRRMRSQILTFLREQLRKDFSTISFAPYTGGLPRTIHARVACPVEELELAQTLPRIYRSRLETELFLIGPGCLEHHLEQLCGWVERTGFSSKHILNFEIQRVESETEFVQNQEVSLGKITVSFLTEGGFE